VTGWQMKTMIGALWGIAYSLIAWVLVSVNGVQQDVAAIRTSLVRMERDAGEFVTKRELDLRGVELGRRIDALETKARQ
jgi:hypothetical protein